MYVGVKLIIIILFNGGCVLIISLIKMYGWKEKCFHTLLRPSECARKHTELLIVAHLTHKGVLISSPACLKIGLFPTSV